MATPKRKAPVKKRGKAVAKKAPTQVPALLADQFTEDQGAGNENVGQGDVALPFLRVLQSLSPQTRKKDPAYVDGAEEGMLINTLTQELHDVVRVIPCFYDMAFVEWIPRNAGGGFVAEYDDPAVAAAESQAGNEVKDTAKHFMLMEQEDGSWIEVLFPMSSTQLKTSRKLNSLCQMRRVVQGEKMTLPRFAQIFTLETVDAKNDKGSWADLTVEYDNVVMDTDVYEQAKAFYQLVRAGQARVDFNKYEDDPDGEVGTDDDGGPVFG